MPGVRSRAKVRRYGRVELVCRSDGSAIRRVGPSSLIVRSRFADSEARAPVTVLKLVTSPWSWDSWPLSAPKTFDWAAIRSTRSCGRCTEQSLVDDRRVPGGGLPVVEGLVDRLGRRQPLDLRILRGVIGGAGLVVQGLAVALEQLLQVGPVGRLQRREDLVELDRGRGLGDGDRVAVRQAVGARAAGADIEEEVALQEDARPDLHLRVAVHRLPVVVDGEGHLRVVAGAVAGEPALADALHALDLADVDAGDPDRRVLADVGRVLEDGVQLEVALERDRLGPGQVGADDDQHDQDQRVADPVRRVALAVDPLVVVLALHLDGLLVRALVGHFFFFFLDFFLDLLEDLAGGVDALVARDVADQWSRPESPRCPPRTHASDPGTRCSDTGCSGGSWSRGRPGHWLARRLGPTSLFGASGGWSTMNRCPCRRRRRSSTGWRRCGTGARRSCRPTAPG